MKYFGSLFVLLVVIASSCVDAISLQFQYGGEWVDLGDSNLGWLAYSEAYNHFNQNGGAYQLTGGGYTSQQVCLVGSAKLPGWQIGFQATAQAAYGTGPRLSGWNFRDLLIHTMYDGVQKITNPTGYQVCVPKTTNECRFNHVCGNQCWKGADKCTDLHWGHRVPSIMRVNVFNDDGSLRPEFFQITITNYGRNGRGKGCSNGINAFGILSGLVPGVGSYISSTVSVMCLF